MDIDIKSVLIGVLLTINIVLIMGFDSKSIDHTHDSNEIKYKLKKIKPNTLGQALRIDGVTPAAIIIILSYIKKSKIRASAWCTSLK